MNYVGRTFANCNLPLDGHSFIDCRFGVGCILVYSGLGPVAFRDCEFDHMQFSFAGPAANTLEFIKGMARVEGGEQFLQRVIEALSP